MAVTPNARTISPHAGMLSPSRYELYFSLLQSSAERHLKLQPVNRSRSETCEPCRLAYSRAPRELLACELHLVSLRAWPPEIAAYDPRLGHELLAPGDLGLDGSEPGLDSLADHRAFKFGECARDLEQELARWGRGVAVLLFKVE